MEEFVKIRYLVGKGSNQKFKRNVPERLRAVAGKTAWVKQLRAGPARAIKEQANNFAVWTDNEIRRLEEMLSAAASDVPINPGLSGLTHAKAEELAREYYTQLDTQNIEGDWYVVSDTDPDRDEQISDASLEAQHAFAELTGEHRSTEFGVPKLLFEHGIIDATRRDFLESPAGRRALKRDRAFQYLCRRLEQADYALARKRYSSLIAGRIVPDKEADFELLRIRHGASPGVIGKQIVGEEKTLRDLKLLFLAGKKEAVSASRFAQFKIPFQVLEETFGEDRVLHQITRDEARKLLTLLPQIPSYIGQHYRGLSIKEAIASYEKKHGRPAERPAEAQKTLQVIQSAFRLALDEQWISKDPFKGMKINTAGRTKKYADVDSGYDPFSIEQLNRLFALPLFTGCVNDLNGCHKPGQNIIKRHRYWAPIIALWSGMRMNEILQLEKEDIGQEGDVAFFHVSDHEHADYSTSDFRKHLKTKQAVRKIPIHPSLIEFGFLSWADKTKSGRLFPEAAASAGKKPSDLYSKRFASNLKAAGIWKSRRIVFHSFRGTFNDALRNAGVPSDIRETINGWSPKGNMDARYGTGYPLDRLSEEISKVRYEGLEVRHLIRNATR